MKRIIAFALAVLMIFTTACSSTPKANKLPLGEDMVNQIISDSKLPVIAEKIDVANDVQGITAEYYNLKDGFSKNPMGSFSTVTGNNGVCVDMSSWSIIGDFFAGGDYMDSAVKVICSAYGQFKNTDSLSALLIDDYKNLNFMIESKMGYWYTVHEGIYFMAVYSMESEDTAVLCNLTLMEKDYFKNYLELNSSQSWAQQIYRQEF